jgi:hypothetical protein
VWRERESRDYRTSMAWIRRSAGEKEGERKGEKKKRIKNRKKGKRKRKKERKKKTDEKNSIGRWHQRDRKTQCTGSKLRAT